MFLSSFNDFILLQGYCFIDYELPEAAHLAAEHMATSQIAGKLWHAKKELWLNISFNELYLMQCSFTQCRCYEG